MADADRLQLATLKEDNFGVYQPSGAFQILRYTTESLTATNENSNSAEIRSDRQISDVKRVSFGSGGEVSFELSYGSHDNEFEYALCADASWVVGSSDQGGTTISTVAPNLIKDSGDAFTAEVGDYVRVSGFSNAANNGTFLVTAAAYNELTLAGKTLVTESAGVTVKIDELDRITNGTTLQTVSFEKKYTDLTDIYSRFSGMGADGLTVNIPTNGIVTGSITYIGKDEASSATGSTTTAATTTGLFNTVDDVDAVLENGAPYSATEASFTLTNNLRSRLEIGTLGAASIGAGTMNVSGTLRAYFETVASYDKFLNQTSTKLDFLISDALGNAYVFEFPEVKFTSGSRIAQGQNQDIICDLEWSAFRDATLGYTMRIHRHAA